MADDLWRRSRIVLPFFVFSFFLRSSAFMAAIHHVIVTSALILSKSPFFSLQSSCCGFCRKTSHWRNNIPAAFILICLFCCFGQIKFMLRQIVYSCMACFLQVSPTATGCAGKCQRQSVCWLAGACLKLVMVASPPPGLFALWCVETFTTFDGT